MFLEQTGQVQKRSAGDYKRNTISISHQEGDLVCGNTSDPASVLLGGRIFAPKHYSIAQI